LAVEAGRDYHPGEKRGEGGEAMSDEDLEKQDNWDLEKAQLRQPVRAPRVVVSVAFADHEFDLVEAAAEESGLRVSTFIREAAVRRAEASRDRGVVFFNQEATVTVASGGFIPGVEEAISSLAKEPA
jgi:uncharacterized protein (DUF1778 family)